MTITGGDQTRFRNEPKKQAKRQAARRLTKTTNESHSATMCGWLHPFTTKQREPTAKHAQAHTNRPTLSKRLCGSPTATLALCQDHDSGSHTGRRKTRKRAIRGKPPPFYKLQRGQMLARSPAVCKAALARASFREEPLPPRVGSQGTANQNKGTSAAETVRPNE